MVLSYSCALLTLTLCATPPSLGSAKPATDYRAAALGERRAQRELRSNKQGERPLLPASRSIPPAAVGDVGRRDNSWWWGARGGLDAADAAAAAASADARREVSGHRLGGLEVALGLGR